MSTKFVCFKVQDVLPLCKCAVPGCSFYYVKSYAEGTGVIHLAAGIV